MDTAITTIYCLIDDWLQARRHQESQQRTVSDAEVMTTAVVAARFFSGNFLMGAELLKKQEYFGCGLSPSRFNRRLHGAAQLLESFFEWLGQVHKACTPEPVYLIDSCPVEVCDNIRIDRCRIYPLAATEGAFRGYNSSKRRFFYGLKIHAVTTGEGVPVEVSLTPGSYNDTKHLRSFELDLPEGSVLYGDKAYNEYFTEDLLADACKIELLPHRKKNSTRAVPAYVEYVQQVYRKKIETGFSLLKRLLPDSIHAVTARGFELKVFLFVLACSIDALL
jgi:transposase